MIFLGLAFFPVKRFKGWCLENKRCLHRGKNPTNKIFASMANQLMFLDTIKYFQQSLVSLANSLTDDEKTNDPKRVLKIYWKRSIVTYKI